jgi:cobalt-zinc-cadmium efflux system outer membrane protein
MKLFKGQITNKKPIGNRFFIGVFVTFTAFSSLGSTENNQVQVLNLKHAISLTINQNPQLEGYIHRDLAQQGRISQARVGERPQVNLMVEDALGTGEYNGLQNMQSSLTFSWLMQQEQIDGRVKAVKSEFEQLQLEKQILALDLAAITAKQFIQILVKEEALKLNQMAVLQAKKVVSAIDERVKIGQSLLLDKRLAQIKLIKQRLVVEDLEHEIKSGKYQLAALWGDVNTTYKLVGDLLALPKISDFKSQLDSLNSTPQLLQLASKKRIAQSHIELAQIEAKPQWQFTTGLRRYESTDDFGLVAGVSIPWGGTDRNAGTVAKLRAEQSVLETQEKALMQQANAQLYVLLQEISHSRHIIQTSQDKIIPTLEAALQEAGEAFEVGKLNYNQWDNIRQALLLAQSELLSAYESLHLQHIEIQRLTGASLEQ